MAYFVSDTIDALDLSSFYARYAGDGRRNRPFDPRMMVKVIVYGYASGVTSSRKLARKLEEDVAFRVLAAGNFPAHRTLSDFRLEHLEALERLHRAPDQNVVAIGVDVSQLDASACCRTQELAAA